MRDMMRYSLYQLPFEMPYAILNHNFFEGIIGKVKTRPVFQCDAKSQWIATIYPLKISLRLIIPTIRRKNSHFILLILSK